MVKPDHDVVSYGPSSSGLTRGPLSTAPEP